jgi:ABC-2 type transport system ATP-binding protein
LSEAIVVEQVTRTFGSKIAVRDLDLVVPAGSIYGFIGPNGAGKTTTIRMILSILFPDRGDIRVLGRRSALEAKESIGYLPEERGLYKKMRVGAFLTYMARLKNVDGQGLGRRVRSWLERVDLLEVEKKRCEELSKGMQQKIQFLAAVIHEPDLLVLDEPFSGLDPVNMRLVRELIHEQHRRGATILFSTHVMVQAEQLCDHIVMMHQGQKVLDDSLTAIRSRHDPRLIQFEPLDRDADPEALSSLPMVESVSRGRRHWEILLREGTPPSQAMGAVASALVPARLELHRPTLEDVFVEIVHRTPDGKRSETDRLRECLREEPTPLSGAEES